MRLAFPSAESFGLWELSPLNREEAESEAEEGCRLVYVAATRAEDRLILSGTFKEAHLGEPGGSASESALQRLLPDLVERGWEGGNAVIKLPAPARAEGTGAAEPAVETLPLRVSVSRPSPERAAKLREVIPPPPAPPPDDAGGPPPLTRERPREVPVGHLSYSALAEYERCGYRFYLERLLGVRSSGAAAASVDAGEEPAPEAQDQLVDPESEGLGASHPARDRALALGNATHAALERAIKEGWDSAEEEVVDALLAAEGLEEDADARAQVLEGVAAWLSCELRGELAGWTLRPEVPFVIGVGGTVIRGQIDLLAEGPGGERTVVDFKTDALRGRAPEALAGRYAAQREVYALAAAGADGAPVRAVHLFLENAGQPVAEEFATAGLDAARERLEAMIADIRGGRFEPTEEPTSAVCFGCPAAARLCPHPAWRPPALRPEPAAPEEAGDEEPVAATDAGPGPTGPGEALRLSLMVFGYGSLASPTSAALSLGRPVEFAAVVRLAGWRRRWTVYRDNVASEKTFALTDGSVPPHVVGLNIERDAQCEGANGVLIELTEAEAERLDLREMRYDRIDVTADVGAAGTERVIAYTAKAAHHAPQPPPGAIIIAEYVRTVEAAFTELGPGELEAYRATSDPPPVEPSEVQLVADQIPPGNPRGW